MSHQPVKEMHICKSGFSKIAV